ncbi:MAG: pilin [Halioglobus sp.]
MTKMHSRHSVQASPTKEAEQSTTTIDSKLIAAEIDAHICAQLHAYQARVSGQRGFTVIELMAVVAIVSILAVISLAVYGDYTIRSKVAEGMAFAAEAKTSVSEYYYNVGSMPGGNGQAGLAAPDEYDSFTFISKLEVTAQPRPGTITVTFKLPGTTADGKLLQLIPSTSSETVFWTCIPPAENGMETNQLPPNCRG